MAYFETAAIGTFAAGGTGTIVGAFYDSGENYNPPLPFSTTGDTYVDYSSGAESDPIELSLDPGLEMRFVYRCMDGFSFWGLFFTYCDESSISWTETVFDPSWVGPISTTT